MEVAARPVRVAIAGTGGRMGQTLVAAIVAQHDIKLAAALEVAGSPLLGHDAGGPLGQATGIMVGSDVGAALRGADVLIDFTRPAATVAHVNACAEAGVGAVIGTTGLSEADKKALADAARKIPLVYAPNMSIGVNVLLKLVALAAQRLGGDYDVEIVEMHHRHKVDAPSGTALQLGEAAAAALGRDLKTDAVFARDGVIGERKPGAIGFATLRGGDVVGDHTVVFAGPGERIELAHKASSRTTFAHGALRAARFVAAQRAANAPGLYHMRDVLGLD
ncbi:MAG TPA: 4-hydroxy-tetrahydrodipicolinate reductase [Casimicrobiaceae bacterium]|nr:4-hydroxy-tetrahydrodipicolinate reductase [Casimicrobiaceae bacterium]